MSALVAAVTAAMPFVLSTGPRSEPEANVARFVDVAAWVPDAVLDLRYATERNLVGRALYPSGARCLLLPPVAARLARAAARLRERGFRLRLYDCYRPPSAQRELWRRIPKPGLVADPRKGSNHSRGAAVDAGLATRDGAEPEMPSDFDAFDARGRAFAVSGVPPAARRHRDLLRAAMVAEGFRPNRMEWWHFDAPEARSAPVVDVAIAP